jgi:predicted anti-sigma-YlaC factor YlaD
MWRRVTGWFGVKRRIVRLPLWLDDRVWGGSVAFLIPAMLVVGWLAVAVGTLTAAVGIGDLVGSFLALALAWPAVPAMFAAGMLVVERTWGEAPDRVRRRW